MHTVIINVPFNIYANVELPKPILNMFKIAQNIAKTLLPMPKISSFPPSFYNIFPKNSCAVKQKILMQTKLIFQKKMSIVPGNKNSSASELVFKNEWEKGL